MKKKETPVALYILLALMGGAVLLLTAGGGLNAGGLFSDPALLWKRILGPLIRLTGFISIGLFVAYIIEGMGWASRLTVMARPFMRWGHLSDKMAAVFTAAFFSGTTALTMLASFHQDGLLNRRELTMAVLLNTFPSFFLHLPTTFFIILPLVGKAGAIYLLLTFCAALLRLFTVIACTRFMLPPPAGPYRQRPWEKKDWKDLFRETGKRFGRRLTRILLIVLPVYLIVALASHMGFFVWLRHIVTRFITSAFIPVEAVSVVVFSLMAEFTSGYAAAGAMLKAGTLTVLQTVAALLIGNIIAAPIRALRHQMPYYMGIFTPGTGIRLMAASQAFRLLSLVVVGLLFFLFAG